MAGERATAMGGGCLGGLLGAILGIMIGWGIGSVITSSDNGPRNVPSHNGTKDIRNVPVEVAAGAVATGFEILAMVVARVVCAGIGGIIGGIGGSVVGAGLASKSSTRLPQARYPDYDSEPANLPELRTESSEAELARLKERVAELEGKKRNEDLSPNK